MRASFLYPTPIHHAPGADLGPKGTFQGSLSEQLVHVKAPPSDSLLVQTPEGHLLYEIMEPNFF